MQKQRIIFKNCAVYKQLRMLAQQYNRIYCVDRPYVLISIYTVVYIPYMYM